MNTPHPQDRLLKLLNITHISAGSKMANPKTRRFREDWFLDEIIPTPFFHRFLTSDIIIVVVGISSFQNRSRRGVHSQRRIRKSTRNNDGILSPLPPPSPARTYWSSVDINISKASRAYQPETTDLWISGKIDLDDSFPRGSINGRFQRWLLWRYRCTIKIGSWRGGGGGREFSKERHAAYIYGVLYVMIIRQQKCLGFVLPPALPWLVH